MKNMCLDKKEVSSIDVLADDAFYIDFFQKAFKGANCDLKPGKEILEKA
jgi:hypothetical protein